MLECVIYILLLLADDSGVKILTVGKNVYEVLTKPNENKDENTAGDNENSKLSHQETGKLSVSETLL